MSRVERIYGDKNGAGSDGRHYGNSDGGRKPDKPDKGDSTSKKKSSAASAGGRLVKGAAIMSVAGMLSKVLGAFFRIPLTNWIGAEGMSYYSAAYAVYSLFLFISTAGLPVAISRMVSARTAVGDYRNAHRVYKTSLYLMVGIGLTSFLIFFFGAGGISAGMENPGAKYSMMAVAPVLLLAPIVSSFRGYSQGQQNMLPTATSEITEQLFRVIAGLSLAYYFMHDSLEKAAAGATFGASAGSAAALILLFIMYIAGRKKRNALIASSTKPVESGKSLLKEVLKIAIPITIGSSILPIMTMIDAAMIMPRLQATGWTHSQAKVLYGLIGGFCSPIIEFPQVFTIAVSVSMVPAVTEAFTQKNRENLHSNIQVGVKTLMLVSFPCMIGLMVMASPILHLLYPSRPEEATMAASTLQVLAFGIAIFSTLRAFSSALQGIGKPGIPVRNLAIGAVAKFILTYTLVGIPLINVKGAAIGNIATYIIAATLNYRSLKKYTGVKMNVKDTWGKPFLASVIMGVLTYFIYRGLMTAVDSNLVATAIAIIAAVIIYFVLIFKAGCVTREEAKALPGGDKIVRISDALHLTK